MLTTAGPAAATVDTVEIKDFRATASDHQISFRIVVCAPIGARLRFRGQLSPRHGKRYLLPALHGRQQHVCPIWHYTQSADVPDGRYATRVTITTDHGGRAHTRRVRLSLRS